MSEEALRRLVEEHWDALSARPSTSERRLRVSPLPIDTAEGPLATAVDHEGHRHLLLPIRTQRTIRSGLDGPVLQLRKRPLEDEDSYQMYADLGCLRSDLDDLFTGLCVDVLRTVEAAPDNPVKGLYRVLDRWKALFQTHGAALGPEQLAGLFAELLVLERLLRRDPGAHRLWLGPKGHRHDFSTGGTAIEVKAGTDVKGPKPRIHGLDQLEAPTDGTLWLAWFGLQRVTTTTAGTGFVELVEQNLRRCDDESTLLGLLAEAGYRTFEADRYRDVRFAVGDEKWYEVDEDFPGLTRSALSSAGLTAQVHDVEYTIDLTGGTPSASTGELVSHVIDRIVEEPA
ncbi:PD-(D/E)XK motif protein [Streptomyces longwoodensis]|uniref:PD-(D/E)XK motif protein n=1 Tax=Streptomyces longwoodensis TaxID=68231 RepID=UPI003820FF43